MTARTTIQIGDSKLLERAKPVTNREIRGKLLLRATTDLVDTMRKGELVGIAAPQIGITKRLFVTEIRKTKYRSESLDILRVFINPRITWVSKAKVSMYEGCGSVNGGNLFGEVARPKNIEIAYLNERGEKHRQKFVGLLSRVIQHEYDHLNGILFTERVTDPRTYMDRKHYFEMKKSLGK